MWALFALSPLKKKKVSIPFQSENQMTESPIERAMADSYSTVQFSRDGTVLVTSSYDGLCRLWSVATVREHRRDTRTSNSTMPCFPPQHNLRFGLVVFSW